LIECFDRPKEACWSNATRVLAYPNGQFFLGQFSSRDGLDDFHRVNFLCDQFKSVQLQEHVDNGKRDALITVGKAVVSRKRIPVGCCEAFKRKSGHGVTELVLRPAKSRFQFSDPYGPGKATVLGYQLGVHRRNGTQWYPNRSFHRRLMPNLFCECPQRVAIFLSRSAERLHGGFKIRVERRQSCAIRVRDYMKRVAFRYPHLIGDFLWQDHSQGVTDLSKFYGH
jgi:hypothetical protein